MVEASPSYSHTLVLASVTISIVASYAAFCFAERLTRSHGSRRKWWLVCGSVVMGLGIWTMHYLGMLAIHLSGEVRYSAPVVLLSLAMAVCASAAALHCVARARMSSTDLLLGTVLLGGGIGAMHYTGMAAMRSCSMQHYSPWLVAVSVAVALLFAWMSLSITFHLRHADSHQEWLRVGGAVVMGSGIAAMHYTAMSAVTFMPGPMHSLPAGALNIGALSGVGITATTSFVLLGALLTAFLDRVTYRKLNDAHRQLKDAHRQLAQAQTTLIESDRALREANQQLRELSIRDGLTKLYNRRHLDQSLETEWRQAGRTGGSISILMLDVDHFKGLNDEYGHPAGDRILEQIAFTLNQTMLGSGSLVARYGGEEFAVLLPLVPASEASAVAEQVRRAIFDLGIPHERSAHRLVTVSVGVCSMVPGGSDTLATFVQTADQALYRAKALGRNRTHTLNVEPQPRGERRVPAKMPLVPGEGRLIGRETQA